MKPLDIVTAALVIVGGRWPTTPLRERLAVWDRLVIWRLLARDGFELAGDTRWSVGQIRGPGTRERRRVREQPLVTNHGAPLRAGVLQRERVVP